MVHRFSIVVLLLRGLVSCDESENAQPRAESPDPPPKAAAAKPSGSGRVLRHTPRKLKTFQPPANLTPPDDARKTESGLAFEVLKEATGKQKPGPKDTVRVHYTGWTKEGRMFDSSLRRGRPLDMRLDRVIPGWTEGVQLMLVGEKRRFWIPANLAYGEQPKRPGAPAGDLIFDIELLKVIPAPEKRDTPKDLLRPPATAKRTKSGLAYAKLESSELDDPKRPTANDVVLVNYWGWAKDGKQFDSTYDKGEPISLPLNRVIPGWTEGMQLMREGELYRFWIPAELAYGDEPKRPGAPAGDLVFDVQLLEVKQSRH